MFLLNPYALTVVGPAPPTVTPRQAMIGGLFPIFVNTDDARDAMVPGAMINKKHS